MRLFAAVILVALHGSAASAASVESWSDLTTIIKNNQVTNVDDLLKHLPEDYTKGYTLIYRTRALNQESVSPRRPRVVLFGQNAKFVLVYNSHPTGGKAKPGEVETIETLEFDPVRGRSLLREIEFNGRTVPNLDAVRVNSDRCLGCHAATSNPYVMPEYTVRGLWDPYNSWAGVYGSLSRDNKDFIKSGTSEFFNFLEFLAEKPDNPRYAFLPMTVEFINETDLSTALMFKNGYSQNPNQMLGMHLADYNFHRVGNILADLPADTRKVFQYLIRGLTLDEETFVKSDKTTESNGAAQVTNATFVSNKDHDCLNMIASFLPVKMSKLSFDNFAAKFLTKLRTDYAVRKALVEVDNMGLSKSGAGFDAKDPFDEKSTERKLRFDSVNSGTNNFFYRQSAKPGYWSGTALFYLFYLMDIPSQDFNTAIARGNNVHIDANYVLSGSASITYGNSARCFTSNGIAKKTLPGSDVECTSGAADEFFKFYLPPRFYQNPDGSALDSQLDELKKCDQLATRSRSALTSYFAGR